MYYRDKRLIGNASFGCSKAGRGLGCESKRWNYGHFETSFLRHVEELELEKLNRSANEVSLRSGLENEVENLHAQYSKIVDQMESLMDAAATVPMVARRLEELEKVRAELASTISAKEDQIAGLNAPAKAFYMPQTGITALSSETTGQGSYRRRSISAPCSGIVTAEIFGRVNPSCCRGYRTRAKRPPAGGNDLSRTIFYNPIH